MSIRFRCFALIPIGAMAATLFACPGDDCPVRATEPPAPQKKDRAAFDAVEYEARIEAIELRRQDFADQYRASGADRGHLRAQARRFVVDSIIDVVFPAWMGTPWGLGKHSTARRPFEKDKVVGCSYFVTSVLENAGLRLSNRYRIAQAPALDIQRWLAPRKADLHRFLSIEPDDLARRVAGLGEGLYVIGLNNHVGFVVVEDGAVDIVHASYSGDKVVVREPLADAQVIANSQQAGYFVSSLFADERLVEMWIEGKSVGPR